MPSASHHHPAVRGWLYAIAALVFAMVLVGGTTRLTDSGLSIVEWRPVTGAIPPLSDTQWAAEFEKYKTSSEYALANKGMSLADFKRIYWWEWIHRFLGRLIGAAFLIPFLFFLWRGWIEPRLKPRLWAIFALGALQGAVGWWMVASGLVNRVDVAQERLAVHLLLACLIFAALLWTARSIEWQQMAPQEPRRIIAGAWTILVLTFVQIGVGGLVAGLKAGLIYDTWPLIDGAFVPSASKLFFLEPAWRNFVDNHLTVQFMHRMTAYALLAVAVLHVLDCLLDAAAATRRGALMIAGLIVAQAAIGIATLLANVPISLALAHQAGAIVVLAAATIHLHMLSAHPQGIRLHAEQPSGAMRQAGAHHS
jgi:cytochrome c oxidase assembly protein subunit 15